MSTLYALLPPLAQFGGVAGLSKRLLRSDALAAGARDEWALGSTFDCGVDALPVAALVRQQLAGDAEGDGWLCADVASVEADMVAARVMACGNLDLDAEEAETLAAPLRPLLEEDGFELHLTTPSRWHLRRRADAPVMPPVSSSDQVLGDNLLHHLPEGSAGRHWRRLLNEMQILLHGNPLNHERRAAGKREANSLWLWGDGHLPPRISATVGQVYSDEPLAQALAAGAGIACAGLDQFTPEQALTVDTLLDFSHAGSAAASAELLLEMLDQHRVRTLQLHFRDGARRRLTRAQRFRVWRRGA